MVQPQSVPPQKKGMSVWAWVAIGCVGLLVLGGVGFGALAWWGAHKVKSMAADFQEHPELAAAKMVIAANPDLETVSSDEQPLKADPAKIPTLKPAFAKDGGITAANASSISDGAAALVMTRASVAEKLGLKVVARVVSHAAHAHEPGLFTTAPVPAMQKALKKAGWSIDEVDLFEVNEAFAVVAMIAERDLGLDRAKLNVNGGACALGHPIGASGARLVVTLLHALKARGGKKGIAALCIGGGEATAIAVELV